jgi:hypothetical protein
MGGRPAVSSEAKIGLVKLDVPQPVLFVGRIV